jgi:hypothetical protein
VALALALLLTAAPADAATTWTKVASPNRGTVASVLQDVTSVPGTSTAWAVGYYYDSGAGTFRSLTQRYNGTAWSNVTGPPGSATGSSQLTDVDATGATNVWAIGYDGSGGLVARYNGTSWTRISAPTSVALRGIEAVSSTQAWAVGYSGSQATVVQRVNGAWVKRYSLPSVGRHLSVFEGVARDPSGGIWAVGWDRDYDAPGRPVASVVVHFDGTSWTRETTPNPDDRNTLVDVAVRPHDNVFDVFAVGVAQDTSGSGILARALVLRRDPVTATWASLPAPPGDAQSQAQLQSVVAAPSGEVWSVGYYEDLVAGHQPLLMRWTAGTGSGSLSTHDVTPGLTVQATTWGVTATGTGTLWAVGYQSTASGDRTLILRGSPG